MINILEFSMEHVEEARMLALMNYDKERTAVLELPSSVEIPDLEAFAENGLGIAAVDGNKLLGYLCCYKPWEKAFGSNATGIFSPIHAHAAVMDNRDAIYKRLYQATAEKWVKSGITYHSIALYAHDEKVINALFSYGFGLRCIDAVRPLEIIPNIVCEGIRFREIGKTEVIKIRGMRKSLSSHLASSPCFMYSHEDDFQKWLNRAENRNSRVFVAELDTTILAFIEMMDDGENFISETTGTKNICGAFCLPEYRGKRISQGLLNHVVQVLKTEGYARVGVDFESFNPTASGFWLKHFTAYTNSVTRRIDECALCSQ